MHGMAAESVAVNIVLFLKKDTWTCTITGVMTTLNKKNLFHSFFYFILFFLVGFL